MDEQVSDDAPDFEPITSQEEFEKRLSGRLAREAKKYADYDDLKAKAARFDELETAQVEANKTWEQKYRDLETQLAAKDKAVWAAEIAAAKGVPASRIRGETREEMEADADELAALLVKDTKPRPTVSGLKSGASNSDLRMDPKERAAAALRSFRKN